MKIIDFHSHNFPKKLAPRALAVMCEKLEGLDMEGKGGITPAGDGTIDTQLRDMDRSGVALCVNCPVCTYPANFGAILRRAVAVRDGAEGEAAAQRLVQLGSAHPFDPDFAAHIAQLKAAGIPGIKLHPNYQGFRLDDPAVAPFFTALRDAGLFVLCHTGFDPGYTTAPSVAGPNEIVKLLTAVPGLKFVAGHVGGEAGNPVRATDALLQFPNCWIDTAVMYYHDDNAEAQRIVREWPVDRIVFGTDYFWRAEAPLIDWVKARRPDPADQELIFHTNAERILNV